MRLASIVCECTSFEMEILSKSKINVQNEVHKNPQSLFRDNGDGQCPLHIAADWPWVLEFLLGEGADVARPEGTGVLPVSYACYFEYFEAVQLLLAAASQTCVEDRDLNILDDAMMTNNFSIFQLVAGNIRENNWEIYPVWLLGHHFHPG